MLANVCIKARRETDALKKSISFKENKQLLAQYNNIDKPEWIYTRQNASKKGITDSCTLKRKK